MNLRPKVEPLEEVTKRVEQEFKVFEKFHSAFPVYADFIYGGMKPDVVPYFDGIQKTERGIVERASGFIHSVAEEQSKGFSLDLTYSIFCNKLNDIVIYLLRDIAPLEKFYAEMVGPGIVAHSQLLGAIEAITNESEAIKEAIPALEKEYELARKDLNTVSIALKKAGNGRNFNQRNGSRSERLKHNQNEKQRKQILDELTKQGISDEYKDELGDYLYHNRELRNQLFRRQEELEANKVGKLKLQKQDKEALRSHLNVYRELLDYTSTMLDYVQKAYKLFGQRKPGEVMDFLEALYLPIFLSDVSFKKKLTPNEAKGYINRALRVAEMFDISPKQIKRWSDDVIEGLEHDNMVDAVTAADIDLNARYQRKEFGMRESYRKALEAQSHPPVFTTLPAEAAKKPGKSSCFVEFRRPDGGAPQ